MTETAPGEIDLESIDVPGNGEKAARRREAIGAALEYIQEHGEATPSDLREDVYPEHKGDYTSGEDPPPGAGGRTVFIPRFDQSPSATIASRRPTLPAGGRGRVHNMAECENCGGHVTDRYRRVFAANDGTLHGCMHCRDQVEMLNGAGAEPIE